MVPRARLDVVDLDGEWIVLEITPATGNYDTVADGGDDGVEAPRERRGGVVPRQVEGVG